MEEKTAQKLVKTMERLCRAVERLAEEPMELTEAEFEEGLRTGRFKTKPDYDRGGCSFCNGVSYTEKPFKVTTQTGRNVETKFQYCPNCGRKL